MTQRIPGTENRDMQLLDEVNNLCPLCGKHLLDKKDERTIKRYQKAHIYPHSPKPQQIEALKGIQPSCDIESLDNLIPLCRDCHDKYDFFTTKEEYFHLLELKRLLASRYQVKKSLSEVPVESDILKVLKELETIEPCEIGQFAMTPVFIKQKIPAGSFQAKVLGLATLYYPYLRLQFQNMDNIRTRKSVQIATEIQLAFQKADGENLFLEDVFNQIVEWLHHKTQGSKTSCEIVIAYFVQNCEVFHAIP